jgi:predicted O-methyltransferase YrrM
LDLVTSFNPLDIYRHYGSYNRLKKELHDLIAETENQYPLELRWSHAMEGSIKFTDAYILKQILHKYKPSTILEIGSFLGFSTRWLLEITKSWNAKVTAVDPNLRHRVFDDPHCILEKLNSGFYPDRLDIATCFFGSYDNSIYYDYEHYEPKKGREYVDELIKDRVIIDKSWNRKFDFIFIDGDHSYESVMNNFEIAAGLLNDGGSISFHDALSWMGVNQAVKEIKVKYHDKAEVDLYGNIDKKIFNPFHIHIDGIGFFRLLS